MIAYLPDVVPSLLILQTMWVLLTIWGWWNQAACQEHVFSVCSLPIPLGNGTCVTYMNSINYDLGLYNSGYWRNGGPCLAAVHRIKCETHEPWLMNCQWPVGCNYRVKSEICYNFLERLNHVTGKGCCNLDWCWQTFFFTGTAGMWIFLSSKQPVSDGRQWADPDIRNETWSPNWCQNGCFTAVKTNQDILLTSFV